MEPTTLNKSNSSTTYSPRAEIEKTIKELEVRIQKIIAHLVALFEEPGTQKNLLTIHQMRNELKDRAKVIRKMCVKNSDKKVLELYKKTISVNYTLGSEKVIKAWKSYDNLWWAFDDVAKTLQIIHDLG